jgi:hypothetical protein
MAKVGVIYIADTKHVLACFTVAGTLDDKTTVADVVGKGLTLRAAKGGGPCVFFPSANDVLKMVVADLPADTLAKFVAAPADQSVSDDKTPSPTNGRIPFTHVAFQPAGNPTRIHFTFAGSGSRKCVLAHQHDPPGDTNPASLITDAIDLGAGSKDINVNYQPGDFVALFVEGFLPIVL